MKRPKWTDKPLDQRYWTDGEQVIGEYALRQAAKALRIDAKLWRRDKNNDAAFVLEEIAHSLNQVADGKTWAEAFDWPAVDGKGE
jgi:hypothetical protein